MITNQTTANAPALQPVTFAGLTLRPQNDDLNEGFADLVTRPEVAKRILLHIERVLDLAPEAEIFGTIDYTNDDDKRICDIVLFDSEGERVLSGNLLECRLGAHIDVRIWTPDGTTARDLIDWKPFDAAANLYRRANGYPADYPVRHAWTMNVEDRSFVIDSDESTIRRE